MPIETITPEDLKNAYNGKKLKILIVPGHDNTDSGTEFNGVREADLNRETAERLYDFLEKDGHFQVYATRDFATGEFTSQFASYFADQASEIVSFRKKMWDTMKNALALGQVSQKDGVGHNVAAERVTRKLYGINKWANENDIDVVLHIHFNDHAGRRPSRTGKYSGFTIYVPEKQFSGSRASIDFANALFNQLNKNFAVSNLPGESRGVTEDQDLIGVGANASLDGVGLLVEYGYIYEPQFVHKEVRDAMFQELAFQTYAGMKKYFEPTANLDDTSLLPYVWQSTLKKGIKGSREVLALQAALRRENLYPPPGKKLSDCSVNGNFGICTATAVVLFQEKYGDDILSPAGLSGGTGFVGPATLKKLNELYGARFKG